MLPIPYFYNQGYIWSGTYSTADFLWYDASGPLADWLSGNTQSNLKRNTLGADHMSRLYNFATNSNTYNLNAQSTIGAQIVYAGQNGLNYIDGIGYDYLVDVNLPFTNAFETVFIMAEYADLRRYQLTGSCGYKILATSVDVQVSEFDQFGNLSYKTPVTFKSGSTWFIAATFSITQTSGYIDKGLFYSPGMDKTYEIFIYKKSMNLTEIYDVFSYLSNKWNIPISI